MSREMFRFQKCTVWVNLDDHGNLIFEGQDFGVPGLAEYEYDVTVPAAEIPKVVQALGGQPGDDVLELCVQHGKMIFMAGEQSWLRSLGIEPGLWIRQEAEDVVD